MTIFKGITDYMSALRWIFHRKVFFFAIIPGLLAIILSWFIFMTISNYSDDVGDWLWSWYTWDFGRGAIDTMSKWVGGLILGAFSLMLFKYVILIASSPFMSPLSERIESLETGMDVHVPFSGKVMLEGLIRGLRITFRNLSRELGLTLLLLILSMFPLFAPFTSVLLLLVQAFYAGFGNMDFTMERYFSVREAASFARHNKLYAIGNGLVFIGLLFIPIVGALVAVPLGAAAGTLGVLRGSD